MTRAPLLLGLVLVFVACGHAPPATQQPAPVVAVVSPSAGANPRFTFRHRVRLDLDEMQLDRGALHRGEVLEAVRSAAVARLARTGYQLAPEEARGETEATLATLDQLDVAILRRALQADLLLLTTVSQWEEPPAGGLENAVTVSIEMTLHDLRDGRLVWRQQLAGGIVRTPSELQHETLDLARAAVAEVMRSLPAP
ncbi:MAG: hypothetical protein COW73_09975 [Nitrospirae bacterium CG18_big_fil_WC_8_21_14_2_50_70_55]|nr:hypothetical protein [Deltaproteobacteria bacterium]OIP64728.1 MAG: hypothetical protein AUK30_06255 [Nitrospirae bacterium CG2_30_70_394]PIQ03857.1 MAG: hypothetical protein COW73_09975 [Nitrospirae bacterium CG18_big_fil_WC_8_21_14_2_50_70_55]PIU79870.1 MAG: hypothetical protein COS73_02270 [Nitrospirae bacterium CG06_land_8_20_14_3_00_70_43]PIW82533.1 MAG: hypothetical protein COZ96_08315 [Nitrospirae bacterium CG_4_8_14_3_um_filter_70_85]PIX83721.1 MAG: hypothetical protein COZ33_03980 